MSGEKNADAVDLKMKGKQEEIAKKPKTEEDLWKDYIEFLRHIDHVNKVAELNNWVISQRRNREDVQSLVESLERHNVAEEEQAKKLSDLNADAGSQG